jgi:hypothetical protein
MLPKILRCSNGMNIFLSSMVLIWLLVWKNQLIGMDCW